MKDLVTRKPGGEEMRDKRNVPVFNSEAENAQWWFDHRDRFESDLRQALMDGSAGVGTVARRMRQVEHSIELDAADLDVAKPAAEPGVESRFRPISVRGEPVSATLLRDRGRR
jgi:hypothetical protein